MVSDCHSYLNSTTRWGEWILKIYFQLRHRPFVLRSIVSAEAIQYCGDLYLEKCECISNVKHFFGRPRYWLLPLIICSIPCFHYCLQGLSASWADTLPYSLQRKVAAQRQWWANGFHELLAYGRQVQTQEANCCWECARSCRRSQSYRPCNEWL